MRVYVCANGMKTLFHAGDVTREDAKKIVELCKKYFGWKRIKAVTVDRDVVLMDADKISCLHKDFFHK